MNQPRIATMRALATVALLCLFAQSAAAQTKTWTESWTERPYNPPVGSRWLIDTDSKSDEIRAAGEKRTRQIGSISELTIDEKLADGFRITYVNRDIQISGDAPGTDIAAAAFGAMKGIVIHARTDASGKPIVIDNLAEVKSTMRTVVDRMVTAFQSKPKVAAFVKQMLEGLLLVDGAEAASAYMEDLPVLAVGQSTGLKPGAVKRESNQVPAPIGNVPIKSVLTTRLESWDDAAGKARFVRRNEMDPEALRQATVAIVKQLSAAASDKITPEVIEMMKNVTFTIDSVTAVDVQDGITRAIDDRSTTTASLMGQTFRKVETKTVKVTPLQ